ncbi:hypothetical protein [Lichenihabitans psoromatis]|uniref:hypothetical protein n=1 Tax=Lichenihabitans psoromatis TaxID=2528642 RepID=UPI0010363D87|nr:hypothetical protein [Lichenihabitans psoromatis]
MTDLASDYASRILAACDMIRGLGPDRRDPHRFHEQKDAALSELEKLARDVQLDQVFAKLPSHPESERGAVSMRPRTVTDRQGRAVMVEVRRPKRIASR